MKHSSVSSGQLKLIVPTPVWALLRWILAASLDPFTIPATAAIVMAWFAPLPTYHRSAVYGFPAEAARAKLALFPAPRCHPSRPPLARILRHDSGRGASNACAAVALAAPPRESPNVENPASVESHDIVYVVPAC